MVREIRILCHTRYSSEHIPPQLYRAPFHCSLMQPAADEMKEALKCIKFEKPVINVISNVTAKPVCNALLTR